VTEAPTSSQSDPFDLQRFVEAQDPIFETVRAELQAGRKRSHWMWFVFPQIEGLGLTSTSQLYAISSRAEAEAYLRHPKLGPRLQECARLVIGAHGRSVEEIFGFPDWRKFVSSMTLFAAVAGGDSIFAEALQKCCGGARCETTLEKLVRQG